MASGITHILLMKNLFSQMPEGELRQILQASMYYLQTGAVAPDLPYASSFDNDLFFFTESELADKFHYEKTNEMILRAFVGIKHQKDLFSKEDLRSIFAFFLGFASHIVADGIIHPYVRDKVGDYSNHKTAHRILELNLDVVFFHHLTKGTGEPIQLNYSNIQSELKNFKPYSSSGKRILTAFRQLIKSVYSISVTSAEIYGWINGLHRMLEVAEGRHPQIYRIIGNAFGIAYENYEQLLPNLERTIYLENPIDRDENFLKRERVGFLEDCVPMFYRRFVPIAEKAYEYVYNDGPPLDDSDIDLIDLDTGRLLAQGNDLEEIPYFWSVT